MPNQQLDVAVVRYLAQTKCLCQTLEVIVKNIANCQKTYVTYVLMAVICSLLDLLKKKVPPPDFCDLKRRTGKIFCFPFSSNFCRKGSDTSYEKWISLIWLIVYFQPVAGGLPDIEANENFGYQWCIQPDPWWDHDWALV